VTGLPDRHHRGAWSFEDVDLAVLTVPTLLSKAEADAAMRVVLEDYGHCDDPGGGRGEGLTRDSAGCVPGS